MSIYLKLISVIGINIATVAVAIAVVLPNFQTAKAATGYTANWELSKCRVIKIGAAITFKDKFTDVLTLGPSEWKVTYTANGKQIVETWSVVKWDNHYSYGGKAVTGFDVRMGSNQQVAWLEDLSSDTVIGGKNVCTSTETVGFPLLLSEAQYHYSAGRDSFRLLNSLLGVSIPLSWRVVGVVQ